MNIKKIFLFFVLAFSPITSFAGDLFADEDRIQGGIDVIQTSDVFADIYEKLDNVKWAGKNIEVVIENLEKLNTNAHIAATGERVVLVWGDDLIANFPYPDKKDWKSYGQITTALVLRMRERDARLRALSVDELYNVVVNALLKGIDENGSYKFIDEDAKNIESKILTSIGFEGGRDERGNFRITGVFKGASADVAGVKEGDIISEINGVRVANMSDADLRSVLNGYNSGTVKVKLLTPSGNKNLSLRRASIVLADTDIVHRASNEKSNEILEIIVHNVSQNSVDIVNEALAKYNNLDGIILDLRTCGGEDERAAAKLAGLFLGQQPVMVISETAVDELEVIPGGGAITNAPVVVLISDSTRGTAEAIAAAFYENSRGVLVGTPTAGQARMATEIELNNGGVLELFNKSIKTGNGNNLDGRGVFPLICLSNIRSAAQIDTFFVNIMNGRFDAHDYNKDTNVDVKSLRKACPNITSGSDEDAMAIAVAAEILTDKRIYNEIMDL
jgi:carboxyl-terminal processing protease